MGLKIQTGLLLLLSISHHALAQDSKSSSASSATSTSTKNTPGGGGAPGGGVPPPAGGGGGGAYNYPPPPEGGGGFPGGFPGGFGGGFPLFPGFFKNFDLSAGAGFGPYGGFGGGFPGGFGGGLPGGLGGLLGGGIPPPDGDIPPPDGGFGGPLGGFGGPGFGGGFGGFGPSYLPSTWIGSALGAKGDLLFPIVIFVFFVVGVWTVIQLLLGFIVPLIASKFTLKGAALGKPGGLGGIFRRDATAAIGDDSLASPVVSPDLDFITNSVLDAINEPKCLKYVACHSGKFLNSMAGGGDQKNSTYEGILKTLASMARSEALDVFENAFVNGSCDCSKYTCDKVEDGHAQLVQNGLNSNSTSKTNSSSSDPTKTNEVN